MPDFVLNGLAVYRNRILILGVFVDITLRKISDGEGKLCRYRHVGGIIEVIFGGNATLILLRGVEFFAAA